MNKHEFVPNARKLYVRHSSTPAQEQGDPIVGFDVETLQDGSISVTPMALDLEDGEVYHATEYQDYTCYDN